VREEELRATVRRAQGGDREAAGVLLELYGERIRSAIRRRLAPRLRSRLDTEDVFQSAVAITLEDLRSVRYEGEKSLVAWLTTVAERRLLGTIRRHRAGRRDVGRECAQAAAAGVESDRTTPAESAERAEAQAAVAKAVARLPQEERRVIHMRSYEGLTFREIAGRIGLPSRHSARELFQRALKRLGHLVENDGSPGES